MRRILGLVLVGTGAALIALAVALPTYVYPRVAQVPADPQRTLTYTGTGLSVFLIRGVDDGGPRPVDDVTLTATRLVTSDVRPAAPKPGKDDVLWRQTFIAEAKGYGVLTAYVEGISFDNRTGEATNCCGDYVRRTNLDAVGTPIKHQGLMLKFPFATQKRDYDYWDLQLGRATPAKYQGEETIDGLLTYKFVQDIPAQTTTTQDVPASVFGSDQLGNVKAQDVYQNRRTIWVEPETGSIIKGQETQNRRLVWNNREVPALVGTITNIDANVQSAVDEYGPLGRQLHLVRVTGPVTLWVVGPIVLLIGLVLLAARRRSRPDEEDDEEATFDPVLPGSGRAVPRPQRTPPADRSADRSAPPTERIPAAVVTQEREDQGQDDVATPVRRAPRRPVRNRPAPAEVSSSAQDEPRDDVTPAPRRPPRPQAPEVGPQDRLRPRQDAAAEADGRPSRPRTPPSRPPRRPARPNQD